VRPVAPFRRWGLLALLMGCAAPEGSIHHIALRSGQDETVFTIAALDAAVQQFIGPATPASGGESQTGTTRTAGGITGASLSPNSATPYFRGKNARLFAEADLRYPLRSGFQLAGRMTAGQGYSHYTLPDGAGILKDPVDITFKTRFVTAEAGVIWEHPLSPHTTVALGAGAGLRLTHSKTAVTAPVLRIYNTSSQQDRYIALRAGVLLQPNPASKTQVQLDLEALAYPGKTITLGSVLALRY
jgi:hypothetical protein